MGKPKDCKAGPLGRGRPLDPHAGYRRIAAELRKRLAGGGYAPLQILPSRRRLAEEFGANENTVKLALSVLLSEGYLRPNAKRRLVVLPPESDMFTRPGYILEVVNTSLDRAVPAPYFAELQHGIETGAGILNAPLVIAHSVRYLWTPARDHLDLPLRGIVLVGHFKDEVLRVYERMVVPVVLVDTPAPGFAVHQICVDNEVIAYDAVRRLIAKGHRRIAFVRRLIMGLHSVDPDSRERQHGFRRAMREAKLDPDAGVFNLFFKDTASTASIQALLNARPAFSAVVTCDGAQAEMVAEAQRKRVASKPLEMVTFLARTDGAPFAGPRIDFLEMGRRAVDLLEKPRHPAIFERVSGIWHDGVAK